MRKEIDIFKALAMVAVIFLHFNAFLFARNAFQSFAWNRTLFIDQLLRFCVPLFVALSGYTLAKKYLAVPFSLKDFYLRRTIKLLPSYIFWSLVIFITMSFAFNIHINFSIIEVIKMLIYGQADYHLYFVPMIFQLYLLFPLIFYLTKKFNWVTLLFALGIQIISYYYYSNNPQYSDQSQYIHFVTWIYYFALGVFLAKNELVLAKIKFLPVLTIFIIIGGFIWCLIDANFQISRHVDLIIVTKTARDPVILYGTGVILITILFGQKILSLPNSLVNLLALLGLQSYLIYLCHTLFLRPIFSFIAPDVNQGNTLIILLGAIGGVTVTFLPGILKKLHIFQSLGQEG